MSPKITGKSSLCKAPILAPPLEHTRYLKALVPLPPPPGFQFYIFILVRFTNY